MKAAQTLWQMAPVMTQALRSSSLNIGVVPSGRLMSEWLSVAKQMGTPVNLKSLLCPESQEDSKEKLKKMSPAEITATCYSLAKEKELDILLFPGSRSKVDSLFVDRKLPDNKREMTDSELWSIIRMAFTTFALLERKWGFWSCDAANYVWLALGGKLEKADYPHPDGYHAIDIIPDTWLYHMANNLGLGTKNPVTKAIRFPEITSTHPLALTKQSQADMIKAGVFVPLAFSLDKKIAIAGVNGGKGMVVIDHPEAVRGKDSDINPHMEEVNSFEEINAGNSLINEVFDKLPLAVWAEKERANGRQSNEGSILNLDSQIMQVLYSNLYWKQPSSLLVDPKINLSSVKVRA